MTKKKSPLKEKQELYVRCFGSDDAKAVLSDLRNYCYATKGIMGKDITALEMARREGRREVFLQIMGLLKVDFAEFYNYSTEDFDYE